jgi:urease accessory protein
MPRDVPSAPAHQRACGRAEVVLAPAAAGSRLRHLYQAAPLRVLFPAADPGEPLLGALVNVAGGVAGGDRLAVALRLEAGARFTLATPAAEKVYRSLGAASVLRAVVAAGPEAVAEWLPQETILFDGARLERRLGFTLGREARLLAAEMLVLGRRARGERFSTGMLHDGWRLHREGRLIWADALRLEDPGAAAAARFGLDDAGAMATLLLAAPDAAAYRPALRERAAGGASLVVPGVLLARWLGEAGAVRSALADAVGWLRAAAFGHPPRPPRLWRV